MDETHTTFDRNFISNPHFTIPIGICLLKINNPFPICILRSICDDGYMPIDSICSLTTRLKYHYIAFHRCVVHNYYF